MTGKNWGALLKKEKADPVGSVFTMPVPPLSHVALLQAQGYCGNHVIRTVFFEIRILEEFE